MENAEFITVCIDNSSEAYYAHNFRPQRDAIIHYCKDKLNANHKTKVVLYTMGEGISGFPLPPTSDFQEIRDSLQSIFEDPAHRLCFGSAINCARSYFSQCPPNMQKRMFFLVGGRVDLFGMEPVEYGTKLKALGIAVDVVNFYPSDKLKVARDKAAVEYGLKLKGLGISNQFVGMELDAFVDAAKSNDNSHIEHVERGSSIPEVLRKSILRKTPCLSTKTNHHKKATHAAGDNKHVRSEVKYGKRKSEAIYLENEGAKLGKRKREAIYV